MKQWTKALGAVLALLLCVQLAPLALAAEEEEETWDLLPTALARMGQEKGTLETVDYFSVSDERVRSVAGIYYPAGYDPAGAYDVVVLWPGTHGTYKPALRTGYNVEMTDGKTHTLLGIHLLDRMIELGYVRPFLMVVMDDFDGTDAPMAGRDILTVLDYVDENCATYASRRLPTEELREHYTLLGFSQGSFYSEGEGMVHLLDRFANFGAISFGSRYDLIPKTVDESPYSVELLYALVGGRNDHGAELGRRSFEVITSAEKITPGENAILRESERYGHDYGLMLLGFYDMLPRILPPVTEEAAP